MAYKPFKETISRGAAPAELSLASRAYAQKNPNYTPLDDVAGVNANKSGYMSREYAGDKAGAETFRQNAVPYYANLIANGYGETARQLMNSGTYDARRLQNNMEFDNHLDTTRNNSYTAIDNSTRAAEQRIGRQREQTEQQYSDIARDAYVSYLQQRGALPQQLKAQGITGGLSESSQVALENSYGQQVNETQLERLAAMQDLDDKLEDVYLNADTQKRSADNDLSSQRQQFLLNQSNLDTQVEEAEKGRIFQRDENEKTRNQSAAQFWAQMTQNQNQFDSSMAENVRQFNETGARTDDQFAKTFDMQKLEYARAYAINMANAGNFGPMATLLGITEQQARDNAQAYFQMLQDMPYKAQANYGNTSAPEYTPTGDGGVMAFNDWNV